MVAYCSSQTEAHWRTCRFEYLLVLTSLAKMLCASWSFGLVAEGYSLLLTDRVLVSGGIFNQSGSVFYRISPENSLLEIQLGKLPIWLPVCYERWNSSLGTLVCRQLGYLRSGPEIGSQHVVSNGTDFIYDSVCPLLKFLPDWPSTKEWISPTSGQTTLKVSYKSPQSTTAIWRISGNSGEAIDPRMSC